MPVFADVQCVGWFKSYSIPLYIAYSPSSHHLLISCLLQFKSLHPIAFGVSASDNSKMLGFVCQLQEVETHSTGYVKSVTCIPITHTHTHMHWVRYVVTWCHRAISQYQSLLCNTCILTYILSLLLHSFSIFIVQATLCHGVSYAHSLTTPHSAIQWPSLPAPPEPVDKDDSSSSLVATPQRSTRQRVSSAHYTPWLHMSPLI